MLNNCFHDLYSWRKSNSWSCCESLFQLKLTNSFQLKTHQGVPFTSAVLLLALKSLNLDLFEMTTVCEHLVDSFYLQLWLC